MMVDAIPMFPNTPWLCGYPSSVTVRCSYSKVFNPTSTLEYICRLVAYDLTAQGHSQFREGGGVRACTRKLQKRC